MKSILVAAVLLLIPAAEFFCQEPAKPVQFAGQWETSRAGSVGRIVLDLKQEGNKLSGTLAAPKAAQPDQLGNPVNIVGKVDGDILAFNLTSPDGNRTITFVGRVNGDEMNLNRDVEGSAGNGGGPGAGIYGFNGPATLSVHRVK
jgi:hypothetical protein